MARRVREGGWCARTLSAVFFLSVVGRGKPRPGSLSDQSETDWRGRMGRAEPSEGEEAEAGWHGYGYAQTAQCAMSVLQSHSGQGMQGGQRMTGRTGMQGMQGTRGEERPRRALQTRLRGCEQQSRKENRGRGAQLLSCERTHNS